MKTQQELAQALQESRKALGLGQKDMRMKIGMSQQQYQRAEAGSDLRLSTLLRILEGLGLELQFVSRQPEKETLPALDNDENNPSLWKTFLDDLED